MTIVQLGMQICQSARPSKAIRDDADVKWRFNYTYIYWSWGQILTTQPINSGEKRDVYFPLSYIQSCLCCRVCCLTSAFTVERLLQSSCLCGEPILTPGTFYVYNRPYTLLTVFAFIVRSRCHPLWTNMKSFLMAIYIYISCNSVWQ